MNEAIVELIEDLILQRYVVSFRYVYSPASDGGAYYLCQVQRGSGETVATGEGGDMLKALDEAHTKTPRVRR